MSGEHLALAALIVLFAYFIRGITGFGSGLIAVPLLAHFLPLPFVVPMVLVLDFSASLSLVRSVRRNIRWDELKYLFPFSIIGVALGVFMLIHMPREPLLAGLGIFVIVFGLRNVLNIHGERLISRWWAIPAALSGGSVGAVFGTGGPPYIIYLSHRLHDKTQLRATFTGLFVIEGLMRATLFIATGLLLQKGMFTALLVALPLMASGLYLGHRVHVGLSNRQMMRIIGTLLLLSGGSLLWKAWGG
ncbi:MAG: sulfite exporter TauE/SafE family protein [Sulfuricellaceae bacterium]|nr:sulfite exporter TauE/SafE family protein [Sulfuricellaceae bacterium]